MCLVASFSSTISPPISSSVGPPIAVGSVAWISSYTSTSSPSPITLATFTAPSYSQNITPSSASTRISAAYPNIGDMTHYNVSVGRTSCGWLKYDSEDVVALSSVVMRNGPNPNVNPICGTAIEIAYQGRTYSATVVDTCANCPGLDLDVTQSLFDKVAPHGDGRVSGVSWRFSNDRKRTRST